VLVECIIAISAASSLRSYPTTYPNAHTPAPHRSSVELKNHCNAFQQISPSCPRYAAPTRLATPPTGCHRRPVTHELVPHRRSRGKFTHRSAPITRQNAPVRVAFITRSMACRSNVRLDRFGPSPRVVVPDTLDSISFPLNLLELLARSNLQRAKPSERIPGQVRTQSAPGEMVPDRGWSLAVEPERSTLGDTCLFSNPVVRLWWAVRWHQLLVVFVHPVIYSSCKSKTRVSVARGEGIYSTHKSLGETPAPRPWLSTPLRR
jgi:hypothetical protein